MERGCSSIAEAARVAERTRVKRLAMFHYDQDYETIAMVTGQPVRWAVPRGTI